MITGDEVITKGDVILNGISIKKNINKVYNIINIGLAFNFSNVYFGVFWCVLASVNVCYPKCF
jgi:hypothetical protein